jgi:hypothetical protein
MRRKTIMIETKTHLMRRPKSGSHLPGDRILDGLLAVRPMVDEVALLYE